MCIRECQSAVTVADAVALKHAKDFRRYGSGSRGVGSSSTGSCRVATS